MKVINIRWQHLDKAGETCARCSDTGKTILQVVDEFKKELKAKDVELTFTEIKLDENEVTLSNMVFFNDIAIEEILPESRVVENSCPSCSTLIGKETCCRAIDYRGKIYECISESLIRKAISVILEKPSE